MAEEAKNPELSSLTSELEAALTTLDSALLQAGRSVAIIRSNVSQFAALTEVLREMEETMARARQHLTAPSLATPQPTTSPPLRPVPTPAPEPAPAPKPFTPEATIREAAAPPPIQHEQPPTPPTHETPSEEPTGTATEPQPSTPVSHCLRLGVNSKEGSLDLKVVDAAVNENPAVVDVALLDYDGRQATLKLWVNEAADPSGVREALLASLQRRLGSEGDAEVSIDFEQGSAA